VFKLKRWTAYRISIKDVLNLKSNENGTMLDGEKEINRVNLIGSVVNKFLGPEDKYGFIIIDDGTETIRARCFESNVNLMLPIKVGDIVTVIGRVKSYNNEIHIIPEIIKKVDPNFELLRKLELSKNLKSENAKEKVTNEEPIQDETLEETKEIEEEIIINTSESPRKKILDIIKELDKGNGADIKKIKEKSNFDNDTVIQILNELMADGTIFQPKAGIVKILD